MTEQEKQERHNAASRVRLVDELKPILDSCRNDEERELVKATMRALLLAVEGRA